jgi:hypothetical protein
MPTRTTALCDFLFGEEKENQAEILTDDNLSKSIVDMSLSLETRIKAIDLYYQKEGGDNTVETINKLATIYEMSGTKLLRQYLFAICEKSVIEPFLKSLAARALHAFNTKDELGYKAIDMVYPMLGPDIGTPYKIDFVKMLMNSDDYKTKAKDYFCQIINDILLDCEYRYKTILSLEYRPAEDEKIDETKCEKMMYFIREANIAFLCQAENKTQYRILAGQYLLQKCKSEIDKERNKIESVLLSFAQDSIVEYNLRADSADVLLQLGSDTAKSAAKDVIMHLGVGSNNVATLYDNAQNVHTREVEDSVLQALEFLQTFELMKYEGKAIAIDFVEKKIEEATQEDTPEKKEKIDISFNRIVMDRALYSKYNCTLSHILLKVWTYLTGHKNESEIKKRLIEELCDMAGTCSSGFASRLVNTISGFGDFSMKISWRDQIAANLTGRLNARIRDMDNLTQQEKVMEEMAIPSDSYELRKNFLKFFRKNMPSIREEMYQEFKDYITDNDYDLYFRTAVSMYETGTM